MVRSFTMRAVAQLESRIGGHVAGILERGLEPLVERTVVRSTSDDPGAERTNRVLSLDFAKEIAADLPLLALADVLGVPAQDRLLMFDWSNRVIGFQDPDYATSASFDPASGSAIAREAWALRPTPDESGRMPDPRTRAGMPDLYAYAHLLATAKRAEPGDDVMSNWLAGGLGEDDPVSVEEFENMFWLFAVAGNETLRNGLPGGMIALLDHPDAQRELRDNPALLDSAVEEMLRWWTPVMVFRRTATRDSVIGATRIAAGDKVVVSFLAANRDPREFEDPAAFRIDRFVDGGSGRHLVFGHGPHLCLGAHLARLQMRTLFSALLAKTTWIEPAGDPVFLRSSFQRGVKRLPVRPALRGHKHRRSAQHPSYECVQMQMQPGDLVLHRQRLDRLHPGGPQPTARVQRARQVCAEVRTHRVARAPGRSGARRDPSRPRRTTSGRSRRSSTCWTGPRRRGQSRDAARCRPVRRRRSRPGTPPVASPDRSSRGNPGDPRGSRRGLGGSGSRDASPFVQLTKQARISVEVKGCMAGRAYPARRRPAGRTTTFVPS
jgi:cytochrome P450